MRPLLPWSGLVIFHGPCELRAVVVELLPDKLKLWTLILLLPSFCSAGIQSHGIVVLRIPRPPRIHLFGRLPSDHVRGVEAASHLVQGGLTRSQNNGMSLTDRFMYTYALHVHDCMPINECVYVHVGCMYNCVCSFVRMCPCI